MNAYVFGKIFQRGIDTRHPYFPLYAKKAVPGQLFKLLRCVADYCFIKVFGSWLPSLPFSTRRYIPFGRTVTSSFSRAE